MKIQKDSVNVVLDDDTGEMHPIAVITQDPASRHTIIYKMQEMDADEIARLLNDAGEIRPEGKKGDIPF